MNIVGDRFGRLIVISQFKREGGPDRVIVRCDCGVEREACSRSVRRGRTRSCGCLQKGAAMRHGASGHPLYGRWRSMLDRCYSPTRGNYKYYGGRGITVCDEWRLDPFSFFSWVESQNPEGVFDVDRRDNDLGYSPGNCRIVSKIDNMRNTRGNRTIDVGGRTLTVAEAAEVYGIPYDCLVQRLNKLGWGAEKAVSTPVRQLRARA